jgi:hypothetical protein
VPAAGIPPGVPILQQQFGTDLRLVVEIAWGGQVGMDPAGWKWTDVTHDVKVDGGRKLTITTGRADEASTTQPAAASCVLDNRRNTYSRSPLGLNYPNVKRNVPVRIRAIYQGTPFTRFFGYATGFTPGWDTTGNYAIATLAANGTLRRLNQGTAPLRSPLERATAAAGAVAYWPMEDTGSSTTMTSPIAGVPSMTIAGLTLAANTGVPGSTGLPTYDTTGTGLIIGNVPAYAPTQYWEAHWYQQFTQPTVDTTVLNINTTGTYKTWETVAQGTVDGAGTAVTLNVYDIAGTKTTLFSNVVFGNFYAAWAYVKLFVSESGGVLTWTFEVFTLAINGGFVSNTLAGVAGIVTSVTNAPNPNRNGMSIGHIAVWNTPPNLGAIEAAANGWVNQDPVTRITRLCAEQGENLTVHGTSNAIMGVQPVDTYVNLLRSCESVDQGLLYDGFNPGLTYTSRDLRENAGAVLTLDASAQDLTPPWAPTDDDLLTVNSYVATRQGGSQYTFADTTSPLGTNTVGVYSSSGTFNTVRDVDLPQYAGWLVHLGTYDGYRYPQLAFSLHRRPQFLTQWFNTPLLTPIVVANIQTALSQMPPENVINVLQGYTESIDQYMWDVVANCSPYDLWRVATIAQEVGDTSEYAFRLESDGASLAVGVAAGATSLSVSTPSGPLWTTAADDFPLNISVAGLKVTVTNITGAGSPQTFTVNPTTYPLPANAAVTLWKQPVLGL